jgi:plasmid maintenance system antidote protein VapI
MNERRPLTANTAIRFAALIGTEADAMLRMQADYDVWHLQQRRPFKLPATADRHAA